MDKVLDILRRSAGASTFDVKGNVAQWFALLMFEAAEAAGIKITEARVRIYAADLADIDPRAVVAAFRRSRQEGSGFFPSVAEVRRQVVATPDDRALLAWNAFARAASDVGAYQSIEVEDPAAARALRDTFGSWPEFCATDQGPDLAIKRQAFLARYRQARREMPDGGPPERLVGICEASGDYDRSRPGLAVGRVTIGGAVETATEGALLAGAPARRQLSAGTVVDDGEA